MRISLLIKTIQPDQSNPKIIYTKETVLQQKLLEKAYFIVKMTGLTTNGLAGQFWLLESALIQSSLSKHST